MKSSFISIISCIILALTVTCQQQEEITSPDAAPKINYDPLTIMEKAGIDISKKFTGFSDENARLTPDFKNLEARVLYRVTNGPRRSLIYWFWKPETTQCASPNQGYLIDYLIINLTTGQYRHINDQFYTCIKKGTKGTDDVLFFKTPSVMAVGCSAYLILADGTRVYAGMYYSNYVTSYSEGEFPY